MNYISLVFIIHNYLSIYVLTLYVFCFEYMNIFLILFIYIYIYIHIYTYIYTYINKYIESFVYFYINVILI